MIWKSARYCDAWLCCADSMVGALMKGYNISFYDDRRVCHMEGCTEKMIAYKWDHAVRDYMDETKRFPTLCCLPKNRSLQIPPINECTDPQKYHEVGLLNCDCTILPCHSVLRAVLWWEGNQSFKQAGHSAGNGCSPECRWRSACHEQVKPC